MRWLFILTTTSLLISLSKIALVQEAQALTTAPIEVRAADYPNRIEITVKISAYEDLRIVQDIKLLITDSETSYS